MRVLAIDPGGATGLAVWNRGLFSAWHVDGQFEAMTAIEYDLSTAGADAVVMESFTITTQTAKKSRGGSNTAIEIIGAVRWLCHKLSVPLTMQSPADARSFSTNAKLARAGFATPSHPDHARSAARHLLLFLATERAIDLGSLIG